MKPKASESALRRALFAAGGAGALLLASPVRAQGTDEFGAYGPGDGRRVSSPQNFALELRVGPYTPKVDNEFGGAATPFADAFGGSTHWAVGFEVDWQAFRLWEIASLGIGGAIHYTSFNGRTFDDGDQPVEGNASKLQIVPMHAVGVLRLDYLVRRTQVPLAFYGKVGPGWAFWASSDSVRNSDVSGVNGSGATIGPLFALGGMVLLDPMERKRATALDEDWGINHSYVYFEFLTSQLGEQATNQLRLGTDTWLFGVALEL
jgi:hypothetical protein